tara:strand:+ start:108 stop:1058 length:951 start_codon:yes stop_codon:yes gene_type:complete
MSTQHDYIIDNSTGANVRSDINSVLQAIASNNSGSSAPSTTYALQTFANTTESMLKLRNAANNDYVNFRKFDGSLPLPDGSAALPSLFFDDDTNTGIFRGGADEFNISTGGTERVVIDSNGRVGIGETSVNASSLIHVKSTNPEIRIQATNGTGATHKIFSSGTNADSFQITGTSNLLLNADTLFFRSTDESTEYMRLTNGNLGINTTAATQKLHVVGNILASGTITPGSDIEFKKDIEPLTDVLSKVKQLVGINFTFKSNNEKSMGLIAQEVEKVYPELVRGDDGNKSLNYMGLTGALIEAIKELATKVEALESA